MTGNIVHILEANAEAFPEKLGIVHGNASISYGELLRNIRRRAAWFASHGIGKGDGVLIVVPMSIRLYEILIALFHIGAVAVFVDAWGDRKRLELARNAFPIKAFVGIGKAHLVRIISPTLRSIPIKLRADLPKKWTNSIDAPFKVSPDDPALITFTTGSTGVPKGANRTHGFLIAQHEALRLHLDPQPHDVDMATLPVFPLRNLAIGSTTVLPEIDFRNASEFDPARVFREMERHNVTTSAGSPAFFTRIAEHVVKNNLHLSSLQQIFVGGAPVFPRTARLLQRAFPKTKISIVYGSTEVEPVSMIDADQMLLQTARANMPGLPVGIPVDSIRLRILPIREEKEVSEEERIEEEIKEVKSGSVGEICVAGDHVLKSYVGNSGLWEGKFIAADGEIWLRTGDSGCLDAEGSLYLLGRVKNSWLRGDDRLFTLPAEMVLADIEGIRIGTMLNVDGETRVFVETDLPAQEINERITAELSKRGMKFDRIVQLPKIPRDPRHVSKIDYEKVSGIVG